MILKGCDGMLVVGSHKDDRRNRLIAFVQTISEVNARESRHPDIDKQHIVLSSCIISRAWMASFAESSVSISFLPRNACSNALRASGSSSTIKTRMVGLRCARRTAIPATASDAIESLES